MAALFLIGLIIFFLLVFRKKTNRDRSMLIMLWTVYFAMGLLATVSSVFDYPATIYPKSYEGTIYLLGAIIISIVGFFRFRSKYVDSLFKNNEKRKIFENALIAMQIGAIIFYLPHAIDSITGDANENRLLLNEKMQILGSYGLVNTISGISANFFSFSLVFAYLRFAPNNEAGRNIIRAYFLILGSLSYVVYITAYVGRDGFVFWLMTVMALYFIFKDNIEHTDKIKIKGLLTVIIGLISIPFFIITFARFFDSGGTGALSFIDYFGSQIATFSDYYSIERPLALGLQNFPIIYDVGCNITGSNCFIHSEIKEVLFTQYLDQGVKPWLFATFVSDFVFDFGYPLTLILIALLSLMSLWITRSRSLRNGLSLPRFLFLFVLFIIPFWGVFYFRYGIANSALFAQIVFISALSLTENSRDRKRRVKPERGTYLRRES